MKGFISWDYGKHKGIVWRCPVESQKGFVVRPFEQALWLKDGRLQDVISTGLSYEFKKAEKENSEIIYVKASNFKIEWGIPIRNGIFDRINNPIGCHGITILRVTNTQNFIFNLVSSLTGEYLEILEKDVYVAGKKGEKKREAMLREKVAQDLIDVRDARRDEDPFLFTVKDLKGWIAALIRNILKDYFSTLDTTQIKTLKQEDLETIIRTHGLKEFTQWGLELVSFSLLGLKTRD